MLLSLDLFIRHANIEFFSRLEEEQGRKEQLQAELANDRAVIDQLQRQLLEQSAQIKLSLQLSQELELQRDRLAAEESRLEMAMLETRLLQQSLTDQRELARSMTSAPKPEPDVEQIPHRPKRTDDDVRDEIRQLRDFNAEMVSEPVQVFVCQLI